MRWILITLWAIIAIASIVILIGYFIYCRIRAYFAHKAKKMDYMELVMAQIDEFESGWFHELKYEVYRKELDRRHQIHVD